MPKDFRRHLSELLILIPSANELLKMYIRYFKRTLDIMFAIVTLILLSPIFTLVWLVIRLEDGGPAIYVSSRVGRFGNLFSCFKFRSMPLNTENVPSSKGGALRITRVGRILRRTNIDELPQLINILIGDMSIVGPRPPLPIQNKLILFRRASGSLECRPGLTGLAQINSFDGMSIEQKAEFDASYAKAISLRNDVKIILKTFLYLLKPPPVY